MANPGTNVFPDTDDTFAGAAGTAYDVYADPIGTNPTTDPDHADQHAKTNRGLIKVEKRSLARELKDQIIVTRTTTATGAGGTLTRTVLSFTVPANKSFVGMQIEWEAYGTLDLTASGQAINAKQAFGATVLGSYNFNTPVGPTYPWLGKQWVMRGKFLITALGISGTGAARGAIDGLFEGSATTSPVTFVSILGQSTGIDTTVSNDLIVSLTFPNTAAVGGVFNVARANMGTLRIGRAS